uniref:Lysozyme inhibitor LprI N-terminal domain-containing protein n=1 Tax=Candidatus Kentrum sp. DK TaxID=2126562 RepID=A0A450S078_9GAMM|nr:MAG: hypothetical protein BECKDK2373B_GA0170837_100820 [Candidatus Kentron sp. DK]
MNNTTKALVLSLLTGILAICPHSVLAQPSEDGAGAAAALRLMEGQTRFQDLSREALEEERAHYRKALDAIYENGFIVDLNSAWLRDLVENWDCRFIDASIRELARRREEVQARLDFVKTRCRAAASQTPAVWSVCTNAINENTALLDRFDRMEKQYAAQCPATTPGGPDSTP